MVVRLEACFVREVEAQLGDVEPIAVRRVGIEVADDGGEGVPQAQHLAGLHIVEVRRRNFGDRFVAVLQEVIRSLHLLSQRHEPIADVRVYEAVA